MRKSLLLALLLFAGFASRGQTLLSESFDGTTFPPTGWTVTTPSSNVNYLGNPTGWARVASFGGYSPAPSTHSGNGMAWFDSYWIAPGGTSDLITPSMSFTATGSKILSFWTYNIYSGFYNDSIKVYINTTNSLTGATLVAALLPTYTPSTTGWVQYTYTLPSSYTGSNNYIIFHAYSNYGYDMYLDDVSVVNLAPCTGTPTAGTATATPNPVCPSIPFTLNAPSATVGSGITYQWQSSPAGLNTWTSIAGATTVPYTVSAGITSATDYRLVVTCTASSSTANSTTASVTLNTPANCYCTPTYSQGCQYQDDIRVITLVGANSTGINQTTPCPTGNVGGYTNYTSLTPTVMMQGGTYSGTLSTDFSSEYLRMWIDFNDDGIFATSEQVYASPSTIAIYTATTSYSISIPSTANTGLHRMRVRLAYFVTPSSSIDPCLSYSYGEARDYTVNILSQVPPAPLVTTNSPVCPGSNLLVTVTPSVSGYPNLSYTLTGPFTGSPISNTTGSFSIANVSSANAGSYTATVTSNGFQSPSSTPATVVVNSVPTLSISNITPPTTCTTSNGSFQINNLTPSTSYTLYYRKNNVQVTPPLSFTSSNTGTYVVTNLAAASYDSIRVQNPAPTNCFSAPVSAIVPAPTAPPPPNYTYVSPICPGSTMTLTVSNPVAGAGYSWTGPGTASGTGVTFTKANMQIPDSGNYCLTVTINGCVSSPTCNRITVTPKDAPPIPNNVVYCQFDQALPLTAQGQGLRWYTNPLYPSDSALNGASPIGPIPSTALPTGVPPIIFYVSQTTGTNSCESPRVPITVTVKPKPQPPVIPQPIIQVCQFEQAPALSASGAAIRWFTTPTGGVGSTTAPTPNTLVSGTFYYYASQTVNGCESDRAITTVIVKPKPQPPAVTSPLQLCQGDPMGPVSALGRDLLWYSTPVGGVGVPVAPVPSTGYEDSFKYYVTQTVSGCESDRALLAVYVNYRPNGIITANSPWVCADEDLSFNYYGNARPDAQYAWYAPPGTHTISGGTTQGPFIVHFDSAGTRVIKLTINNKGCISDLISAPITVRPLPVISYVNRQDVCEHDLVNIALSSQTSNISSFHFNFGSDDAIVEYSGGPGGPFGIRYPKSGHYQVSVTATANTCTSKPKIQDIYVHALPDATIHPGKSPVDICASDTLFLQVAAVPEGAVYTWTPAAYFQGHKDTLNNSVFAVVSQTSEVKVHIKTAFGCEATDSIKVSTKPCCGVFFPNAFAPTGNVIQNRLFRPITNGVHRVNNFRIVNRWGQVMYESKVERNGWDGTYNGVPQDMGTYYYYISYRCEGKDVEERGEFILLR